MEALRLEAPPQQQQQPFTRCAQEEEGSTAAALDAQALELALLEAVAAQRKAAPPNGVHRRVLRFVFGGLARGRGGGSSDDSVAGGSSDEGEACGEELLRSRRQQQRQQRRQRQQQQLQAVPALGAPAQQLQAFQVPHSTHDSAASVSAGVGGAGGSADSLYGTSDDDDAAAEDLLGGSPFASCADLQVVAACRREVAARRLQRRAAAAAAVQQQQQQQQDQQQREQQEQQRPAGPLRRAAQCLVRALRAVARVTGPQGPGNNDTTYGERALNVLTSLPFALVGAHSLRLAGGSAARRHFGLAFVATGAIAAAYHATSGWARLVFRRADYYSIAYTSAALRAAAGLKAPRPAALAAALLAPLKPTLVTGANIAFVEARFVRAALRDSAMRAAFGTHMAVAAAALTCFSLEDVLVAGRGLPPVVHALWHALAAATLGLMGPLLAHADAGAAAAATAAAALMTA